MQFVPLTHSIGATVLEIDLTRPLTDSIVAELRQGLLDYEVLFFRDQAIGPEHHLALAQAFGEPSPHGAYPHVEGFPAINILKNDPSERPKIDSWHTDMTFMERPPLGSILHGVIIPPSGGDTLWASLSAAYEALSPPMQEFLLPLKAVHSFAHGFRESLAEPGGPERLAPMLRANPPCEHPVIRTHPESGRRALFVNQLFTTHIVGLGSGESRAILDFLYEHMLIPEFSCRFRWEVNSIAFWDNRSTLHRPVNDYWPEYRTMQRITVAGDRPV